MSVEPSPTLHTKFVPRISPLSCVLLKNCALEVCCKAAKTQTKKSKISKPKPFVLVDGNFTPPGLSEVDSQCVIGGDGLEYCIAAASIIAKVTRDRLMVRYERHDFKLKQQKNKKTSVSGLQENMIAGSTRCKEVCCRQCRRRNVQHKSAATVCIPRFFVLFLQCFLRQSSYQNQPGGSTIPAKCADFYGRTKHTVFSGQIRGALADLRVREAQGLRDETPSRRHSRARHGGDSPPQLLEKNGGFRRKTVREQGLKAGLD